MIRLTKFSKLTAVSLAVLCVPALLSFSSIEAKNGKGNGKWKNKSNWAHAHARQDDNEDRHWYDDRWNRRTIFQTSQRDWFRDLFLNNRISGFDYNAYNRQLPPGIARNLQRGKPLPPGIAKKVTYFPNSFGQTYLNVNNPYYRYGVVGNDIFVYNTASNLIVDILRNVLN